MPTLTPRPARPGGSPRTTPPSTPSRSPFSKSATPTSVGFTVNWGHIKPSQDARRVEMGPDQTVTKVGLSGPSGATSNRHPGAKSDCQGHHEDAAIGESGTATVSGRRGCCPDLLPPLAWSQLNSTRLGLAPPASFLTESLGIAPAFSTTIGPPCPTTHHSPCCFVTAAGRCRTHKP